jgi:hypothetical protein
LCARKDVNAVPTAANVQRSAAKWCAPIDNTADVVKRKSGRLAAHRWEVHTTEGAGND